MPSYVYIMASGTVGTLYTGATSDLVKRVYQHKNKTHKGFTARYKAHRLVWYEIHDEIINAIQPEKQIKNWRRQWKIQLIEKLNPAWRDIYGDICT